ncbi:MAG TPA: protein kinase [Gemmatimonadales bacterium]
MNRDLRDSLSEALGSGFRILRELSGGGMSRIFLAEELALDREVVVKVLAPELVGDNNLERFRREILQTARLQHPSIVPLLTVGAVQYANGAQGPYYIMPYIRGETLRSRLQREGAFATAATVRVLRDVLEALVHAHHHGVVHRDIKPENIFISGGHAVVTDFGIAKAISGGGESAASTLPGLVVGTPMYMAPEQAGDEHVDHRADLYSLGVVAYELLAGRAPFAGMTTRQVIVAHARAAPEPISRLRPDLVPELAQAVMRCLEREPDKRWQSAEEMLRHLEGVRVSDPGLRLTAETEVARGQRRMGWVAAVAAAGVLAVLAFRQWAGSPVQAAATPVSALLVLPPTMSGDSAGISALATALRMDLNYDLQRRRLTVLAPMAAEELLGLGDFRAVADSLKARYLLQSELLRVGDSVRVNVSLDDYRSSLKVLWSGQYSLPVRGVVTALDAAIRAIADSIVDSVTAELAGEGDASARGALARGHLPPERATRQRSPEVAALLAEADKAMRLRNRDGFQYATELYRRAAALDPDDPGPHSGLSSVYALLLVYTYRSGMDLHEAAALSLAHAERAVELDPASDEALTARAYILNLVNAPTDTVRRDFAQALTLNPSSQPGWYSVLLMREGQKDSALSEAFRGVAQDPNSPGRRITIGWDAIGLREDALAVAHADSTVVLDPELPLARGLLARALLAAGRLDRCARLEAGPYLGSRAACLHRLGRLAAARDAADSLLLRYRRADQDSVYDAALYAQELAIYFAALGEGEAAVTWVREAFARSPGGIPWPFLRSRLFDPVRGATQLDTQIAALEREQFVRVRAEAARQLALLRAVE